MKQAKKTKPNKRDIYSIHQSKLNKKGRLKSNKIDMSHPQSKIDRWLINQQFKSSLMNLYKLRSNTSQVKLNLIVMNRQ